MIIFICSSIYSVYSLVTVTILCDGGINCRWQLKVKCDYLFLFLYLFSLFFSDCYHNIVWWRNQLSVATQGKMWLFLFVDIEDCLPSGCLPSRHWQCMALFREKAVLTDINLCTMVRTEIRYSNTVYSRSSVSIYIRDMYSLLSKIQCYIWNVAMFDINEFSSWGNKRLSCVLLVEIFTLCAPVTTQPLSIQWFLWLYISTKVWFLCNFKIVCIMILVLVSGTEH